MAVHMRLRIVATYFFISCLLYTYSEATQPDFCSLPSETGRCRAAFRRYFFNSRTGQCEQFIYGGCGGNENNFRSKEECLMACGCSQDLDLGVRVGNIRCRSTTEFHYSIEEGQCSQFEFLGCGGNLNRFQSSRKCSTGCAQATCFLPATSAPCTGEEGSYFYNHASRSCEAFPRGSCGTGANSFSNMRQCRRFCEDAISSLPVVNFRPVNTRPKAKPRVCQLDRHTGMACRGRRSSWRYAYQASSGTCSGFIYKGCGGNKNNFRSFRECRRTCAR